MLCTGQLHKNGEELGTKGCAALPPGFGRGGQTDKEPGAMPRDVLGLDPYQASAVSCAKRGAILAALLTLGAIGLTVYGLNGGGELYTYLGATSFGTSVLSFCLANRCARHTTPHP